MKIERFGRYLLVGFAIAMVSFIKPAYSDQAASPAPPDATASSPQGDAKAAKDALDKLATLYSGAQDLTYTSTIVVYGPVPEDPKAEQQTVTLLVKGAAEKPNKFSIKGNSKNKLTEFIYSDWNSAYKFDPVVGYYVKLNPPDNGADLPPLHKPGIQAAMEYATSFAARMFFADQPYDISEATTFANGDVQYSSQDQKIGTEQVTTITEVMKEDNGSIDTYKVSLDHVTGLPRRVSEEIATNGKTTSIFTEDYNSIHVGSAPDDIGTYAWLPPALMVIGYTPPDQQTNKNQSGGQPANTQQSNTQQSNE